MIIMENRNNNSEDHVKSGSDNVNYSNMFSDDPRLKYIGSGFYSENNNGNYNSYDHEHNYKHNYKHNETDSLGGAFRFYMKGVITAIIVFILLAVLFAGCMTAIIPEQDCMRTVFAG